MKKLLFLSTLLLCSLLHVSCNPDDVTNNPTTTNPVDVYVAGSKDGQACYWKNGQIVMLDSSEPNSVEATKIIVSNNDVYVLGNTNSNAQITKYFLWKNNILTNLTASYSDLNQTVLSVEDMFIEGNNIYFSGHIQNTTPTQILVFWKNGQQNILGESPYISNDSSIFVKNNQVFVKGYKTINGVDTLGYYKDGVFYPATYSSISGITSDGNSVFVYGSTEFFFGYYKNISNNVETVIPAVESIRFLDFNTNTTYYTDLNEVYKNNYLFYARPIEYSAILDIKVKNDNIYLIRGFGSNPAYSVQINNITTQQPATDEIFKSLFIVQN
jgi:hypothetical protein